MHRNHQISEVMLKILILVIRYEVMYFSRILWLKIIERTDVGNAASVLDGNIDPFINAYLNWISTGKKEGEEA